METEYLIVGQVAQSVEQGTENPRVGGSIPSLATEIKTVHASGPFFVSIGWCEFIVQAKRRFSPSPDISCRDGDPWTLSLSKRTLNSLYDHNRKKLIGRSTSVIKYRLLVIKKC